MSSGGYDIPHSISMISSYEPRRTSGPIPSSYERPQNPPIRRRSPSPTRSRRGYDSYVPPRSGITLGEDHTNTYRTINYMPDYPSAGFYTRSSSPERSLPLPRTAETDIWTRSPDWQAYKPTRWQDRKAAPPSPTTSVRSRAHMDDIIATRMFEPSQSWKQNNSDRPLREDSMSYLPDRISDNTFRPQDTSSDGFTGLGRSGFIPGGDHYKPAASSRYAWPDARTSYDAYHFPYGNKRGNRTSSLDREHSPIGSQRRDPSSAGVSRTWDHYEPLYVDHRSSRYESSSRSPDWKRNDGLSSSPHNSELSNGRRIHGDSETRSAKKEVSRRSSHSSIASTHVSDRPQTSASIPSKPNDPRAFDGIQTIASHSESSSAANTSTFGINNTVVQANKDFGESNAIVDLVPPAAQGKRDAAQAPNACDVSDKDLNISLQNRPNPLQAQTTTTINGGSPRAHELAASKPPSSEAQPLSLKPALTSVVPILQAPASHDHPTNDVKGSTAITALPLRVQYTDSPSTSKRPQNNPPTQPVSDPKQATDVETPALQRSALTQAPRPPSSSRQTRNGVNGDIKSLDTTPKPMHDDSMQSNSAPSIEGKVKESSISRPPPLSARPFSQKASLLSGVISPSSPKSDENILLELPARFTSNSTFSEIPSLVEAKSFTEALRAIVMTRLLHDHQSRDDIVNPVLMANTALSEAHPTPRKIQSSTPEVLFDDLNDKKHSERLMGAFNVVKPSLVEHFEQRQALVSQKVHRLSEEYVSAHARWKIHCAALNEQQRSTLASEIESIQHTGRTTRRTTAITDAVRSDLEMEQIIASLGNDDATDPNYLSARNCATIPDMISVTQGKIDFVFDDTNHIVENPSEYYAPHTGIDDWTEEEKHIFIDKFAAFPKQFGIIADYLPHKTPAQCVDYYYLHKKRFIDFRKVISQFAPNKRRRRGPGKKRGNGLLADIAQHDAEVARDNGRSPSSVSIPSRAAKSRRGAAANANANAASNTPANVNNNLSDTMSVTGTPQAEAKRLNPRKAMVQFEDTPTSTPTPEPDSRPRRKRASVPAPAPITKPAPQPARVVSTQSQSLEEEGEEEALEPELRPTKRAKRGRKQVKSAAMILEEPGSPLPQSSNPTSKLSTPAPSAPNPTFSKPIPSINNKNPDERMGTKTTSSLMTIPSLSTHPNQNWSEGDKSMFMKLLTQYGDDFKRIAASMPNKTTAQVSNFYRSNVDSMDLEKIAKSAPKKSPTPDTIPFVAMHSQSVSGANDTTDGIGNSTFRVEAKDPPSSATLSTVDSSPPMASLTFNGGSSRPSMQSSTRNLSRSKALAPSGSISSAFCWKNPTRLPSSPDPLLRTDIQPISRYHALRTSTHSEPGLGPPTALPGRLSYSSPSFSAHGLGALASTQISRSPYSTTLNRPVFGTSSPGQSVQPHIHPVTTMVQPYGMGNPTETSSHYHPSTVYDVSLPPNTTHAGTTTATGAPSSSGSSMHASTRSPQTDWSSKNLFDLSTPSYNSGPSKNTSSVSYVATQRIEPSMQSDQQGGYTINHYPSYPNDRGPGVYPPALYQQDDRCSSTPIPVYNGCPGGRSPNARGSDESEASGSGWGSRGPKRPYYYS